MEKTTLRQLPVGTTIYFFRNGKERYLRKMKYQGFYLWYSREFDYFFRESEIPDSYQVMRF